MSLMKNSIVVALLVFVVLSASLLLLILFPDYLSYQRRVQSNTLIVEGWMPHTGLSVAYEEFINNDYAKIFITGSWLHPHTILYINSYLLLYPVAEIAEKFKGREHVFHLNVESTLGPDDPAHFVFWVNDQPIADYYTDQLEGALEIAWEGALHSVDSLMIQYTNDMIGKEGDRNLRIVDIRINDVSLMNENANRVIDRGRPFGRFRWSAMAVSFAELAAEYFLRRGIDSEKIIVASNFDEDNRRTLGNALALKQWLNENQYKMESGNVVSMDYHSRRTWMVYQSVLGFDADVGIISADNPNKDHSRRLRYPYIFRETIAMIYYVLFVFPWLT